MGKQCLNKNGLRRRSSLESCNRVSFIRNNTQKAIALRLLEAFKEGCEISILSQEKKKREKRVLYQPRGCYTSQLQSEAKRLTEYSELEGTHEDY